MYCIYLKENQDRTSIHIEGYWDSVDKLAELIAKASLLNQKNGYNVQVEPVVLDLSKTEAISEECMKGLLAIKSTYDSQIKFLNYSLYIEMQLKLHNLIVDASEPENIA